MSYRIAGIDVHKKMLAVVVSDVEIESEYQFERRMFSSNPEQLRSLAAWFVELEAEEVDLADPASGNPLRRTGPSSHQTIQVSAHVENDSATPKSGLSDRITESSNQPSTGAVIFDFDKRASTGHSHFGCRPTRVEWRH